MKRILAIVLAALMLVSLCACADDKANDADVQEAVLWTGLNPDDYATTEEYVDAMIAQMTITQKAAQMMQVESESIGIINEAGSYNLSLNANYGSVLSGGGGNTNNVMSPEKWSTYIDDIQNYIGGKFKNPIPVIYGIDAVHGFNKGKDTVVFPHNIGLGAANNPELTYKMGYAVGQELKLSGILLDFAPCIALADDPRWGRTYESYSTETSIVTELGLAFSKGLMDAGVSPCAKHFIGDGNTTPGSGTISAIGIDQGNTEMTEKEIRDRLLEPYIALVDAGVKYIMPSYSKIDGLEMHENYYWLTTVLKEELGFDGVIISDYNAIDDLSGGSLFANTVLAVNAGIDLFMQPFNHDEIIGYIVHGVNHGQIEESRVDDAVRRILTTKIELGILADPTLDNAEFEVEEYGCDEYREIAKELVSSSLVMLKNDGDVLPLKEGTTVLVTGPAADDMGVQCGGWTQVWQGHMGDITEGDTILEGLENYADEYGLKIIDDEKKVDEADVILLCVGEKPYAEMQGDATDISLTNGTCALGKNEEAIEFAKESGKPVVTLIVAGRNMVISEHAKDWDGIVMCYLPGTEGEGVAANLVGEHDFTGRLAMPWYYNNETIGTVNHMYDVGYGLSYTN